MRKILLSLILLMLCAHVGNAAVVSLYESTADLGAAFGQDFRLTVFDNFEKQNDMNTELYGILDGITPVSTTIADFMGADDPAEARAVLEITASGVTVQADDPTSSSAEGLYGATTSGDFFFKSPSGLFNISSGTYTADPVVPTLTARVIGADGTTLTLTGSASLSVGAGGNGGFDVDCSTAGSGITATYSSGAPGTDLVYTLGTTVLVGDTCDLDYTQPGDGIEATTGGGDLASITSAAITNNSEDTGVTYLIDEDFSGTGLPTDWTVPAGDATIDWDDAFGMAYTYGTTNTTVYSPAFTASSTVYFGAKIHPNALPASTSGLFTFRSSSANRGIVYINSTGQIFASPSGGTAVGSSAGVVAADTDIYVKVKLVKGTGANSTLTVWTSSNGTSWTQQAESTNGTNTSDWVRFVLDLHSTTWKIAEAKVANEDFNM